MTTSDAERHAYIAGDTRYAQLLARIDELQRLNEHLEAENEWLSELVKGMR